MFGPFDSSRGGGGDSFENVFDSLFRDVRNFSDAAETFVTTIDGETLRSTTRSAGGFRSAVDIQDLGDSIRLQADLPGVKKDNIDLTYDNGQLCLQASRSLDPSPSEDSFAQALKSLPGTEQSAPVQYLRKERREGSFKRCWSLPYQINSQPTSSYFDAGVLSIDFDKETREAQSININF